jgi:hypothetical protein
MYSYLHFFIPSIVVQVGISLALPWAFAFWTIPTTRIRTLAGTYSAASREEYRVVPTFLLSVLR